MAYEYCCIVFVCACVLRVLYTVCVYVYVARAPVEGGS